jgi:tetratricopeptide (TPR) repeat protein
MATIPQSYLARACANLASGFLRDCAAAGHTDPTQPVYLLETGSGSRGLGYTVHRHLTDILGQSPLAGAQVKLVLAASNIAERRLWNKHFHLKALSETGCLDIADWDIESDVVVRLKVSGRNLSSEPAVACHQDSFANPAIVVSGSLPNMCAMRRLCGERFLLLVCGPVALDAPSRFRAETGGTAFVTADSFGAFCLLPGQELRETSLAFRQSFENFNPLDFEALVSREPVTVREYLAQVRLSNYDAEIALRYADRMAAIIVETPGGLASDLNSELRAAIRQSWDGYYPIDTNEDLPIGLARVASALGDLDLASELLNASLAIFGESGQRAFAAAIYNFQRDQLDAASELLEKALQLLPGLEEYQWLGAAIAEKRKRNIAVGYDRVLESLSGMDRTSPAFLKTAKELNEYLAPEGFPPPDQDLGPPKKLAIGMSTFDDWDGVYFSVMAIRLFHPEVTDDTEIVVLDNHPGSPASKQLADLANWVSNYRYIPVARPGGTAARDLVFRHANADFVLCMDSHVFFAPGALAKLLKYIEDEPGTLDLLQGPMVYDDLRHLSTHWNPEWRAGMFGTWATDQRGADPTAEPFDIPLQGLGVFACRRDAWLGFNPRFQGFGGEEGYIHEKFRQAGARTLCLPFLRWVHRFARPGGVPYRLHGDDRIRNYLIGFAELGLDPAPAIRHFEEEMGLEHVRETVERVRQEMRNPFHFFDAIYCINADGQEQRWQEAMEQCRKVGIADLVLRFPAVVTPHNHHVGCALSHRAVVAEARRRGLNNVLVLEDDVVFAPDAIEVLERCIAELRQARDAAGWGLLYLGGCHRSPERRKVPGCQSLEFAHVSTTHAVAYSKLVYSRILKEMPQNPAEMALWLRRWYGFDWYLLGELSESALLVSPVIASQRNLLPFEERRFEA